MRSSEFWPSGPFHEAEAMSVALQSSDPPAEAAAKVLIRLGLTALFVALPCTGIFWRGAIYVLLPVGATLILIGAVLDAPRHIGRRLHGALVSPVGCATLFLTFWACLSLLWTPFPEEAADRFFKSASTTVLAVLVAIYLPQKTKNSRSLPAAPRPRRRKRGDTRPCPFWLVLVFGRLRIRRNAV